MSILTIATHILAFEDADASSMPKYRLIDWSRSIQNVPCDDPQSRKYSIDPLAQEVVFDGQRTLAIDSTSRFSLGGSPLDSSRYRITWTGGTAPGFRTDRGLDLTGVAVTVTVNSNSTVTLSVTDGTPFSVVQDGDVVFIPGISTGDSRSVFNSMNEGYWTVLSVTATSIALSRFSGETFQALGEVVTVTAQQQVQAFSTTGVQVGDFVTLSAGFAMAALRSYAVRAVNPSWIEVISTSPLGSQTGVAPGAAGMTCYTNAKTFLHIEGDQEFAIRLNGATDDSQKVEPWLAGDPEKMGSYQKCGPCWKLVIVNKSPVKLNVIVLSAE